MATVRLTDVIVPEIYDSYTTELSTELNAFWTSGIVEAAPVLSDKLAGGGRTFNFPFWQPLGSPDSNISGDDPASSATPNKITAERQIAVRLDRNQGWQSADLAGMLAGDDPMEDIARKEAGYWDREWSKVLSSTVKGVIADNVANDSGDMINDIGNDNASAVLASEKFNADAYLDAIQTLGDHQDMVSAIAVHSVVYNTMKKLDLIDFIPDSEGKKQIATYQGARVIVSDQMPTITGTNRIKYYTVIFTPGSLGWGTTAARVPVEIDRDILAADGGGVETMVTRKAVTLHPYGFAFLSASVANESPTNTELEAAANWNRVFERKNVGWCVLSTNG